MDSVEISNKTLGHKPEFFKHILKKKPAKEEMGL